MIELQLKKTLTNSKTIERDKVVNNPDKYNNFEKLEKLDKSPVISSLHPDLSKEINIEIQPTQLNKCKSKIERLNNACINILYNHFISKV